MHSNRFTVVLFQAMTVNAMQSLPRMLKLLLHHWSMMFVGSRPGKA